MLIDRGPFRRKSLKGYLSQMSTPNPNGVFDDQVAEILEQQGFSWEESPRSVYDPQQLWTALERFTTDWDDFEKLDEHLKFGFRMAFKIFAKPKDMRPIPVLTDSEVIQNALKLSKSSGLPMMTSKGAALVYAFDREGQIRLGLKHPNPCVAYKRTQKGNKTRLVWGYPLEMTIMEARFARALINVFKKTPTPMAFAMTKVELGAKLHRYFTDQPGTTICLDYSKFDSTISRTFIQEAFRILSTWFRTEDLEEFGWKTMTEYFISTPIVMPDGHLYCGKRHGVPSGSYFTQMVDSVVNVAFCYALKSRFCLSFKPEQIYVLGDDVIMKQNGKFSLPEMAQYLAQFGLILHDDEKTVVGEEHFLGAVWKKGKPDASLEEICSKAVFPERFRKYGDNPHSGAEAVVRSYATSYLSGIKMVPSLCKSRADHINDPGIKPVYNTNWLSGSDKFLLEEYELLRKKHRCKPTLSLRFML